MSIEERGRVKVLEARVEEMGAALGKLMLEMAELREKMKEAYSPGGTGHRSPPGPSQNRR